MAKIKIVSIINEQKNFYNGIKNKNSIIYKENDILVHINYDDDISITRENKDYKITLNFNKNEKTKIKYTLKEYNKYLELELITKNIKVTNNSIDISYKIIDNNEQNINFRLEFEEIV